MYYLNWSDQTLIAIGRSSLDVEAKDDYAWKTYNKLVSRMGISQEGNHGFGQKAVDHIMAFEHQRQSDLPK